MADALTYFLLLIEMKLEARFQGAEVAPHTCGLSRSAPLDEYLRGRTPAQAEMARISMKRRGLTSSGRSS